MITEAELADASLDALPAPPGAESSSRSMLPGTVARATAWTIAFRAADRGLGLVRTLVLARLLAPTDFGLFGIALISLSAVEMLSQTGVQASLVQRQTDISASLDTAWTLQAVRGFVLSAIMWLSSGLIADFFAEPLAAGLVWVLALATLLHCLTNIGVVYFHKDMRFERHFSYMFAGTVADVVVGIVSAIYLRNAWALIYGMVAGSLVRAVASYVVHPYRPKLRWNAAEVRLLYSFGKWVFGSSGAIFLITQGDDIVVGKLLGVTALGYYQVAYLLSNLPATQITHLVSEVALPLYARLSVNPERLRRAFLSVVRATALVALPIAGAVAVFADDLMILAVGAAWQPAAPVVRVLALLGALRAMGAANGTLFLASAAPRYDTITAGIHLTLMVILIYPLTLIGGLTGVALAVTLPMVISQTYGISRAVGLIGAHVIDYIRCTASAVLGTAAAAAAVILLRALPAGDSLLFSAAVAGAVYAGAASGVLHMQGVRYSQVIAAVRGVQNGS